MFLFVLQMGGRRFSTIDCRQYAADFGAAISGEIESRGDPELASLQQGDDIYL